MSVQRFRSQTYYEMLGVSPRSSKREIQAAFLRLDAMYRPGSLSLHSLLDAAEIDEIRAILTEAKEALLNEVSRRAYDRQLVEGRRLRPDEIRDGRSMVEDGEVTNPYTAPAPAAPPAEAAPIAAFPGAEVSAANPSAEADAPPPPEPAGYDGPSLKAFRETKGVSMEELCRITKISRTHFENLEAARFDKLPAKVYLRGFLKAYAELLGLDPEKTAEEYLGKMPA